MRLTISYVEGYKNRPSRDLDLPGFKNLEGLHSDRYLCVK